MSLVYMLLLVVLYFELVVLLRRCSDSLSIVQRKKEFTDKVRKYKAASRALYQSFRKTSILEGH